MNWKFWSRRPKPPANPSITFALTPEGTVVATGSFPDLGEKNAQEGHWFGKMAFLFHSGQMLPAIQKALATVGNGPFTHAALDHFNRLLAEKAQADVAPLVCPTQAFGPTMFNGGRPND